LHRVVTAHLRYAFPYLIAVLIVRKRHAWHL